MKQFLLFLAIGLAAGIIDIIPMIIKKLDLMFILSALSMWIVVGVLIQKTDFTNTGWLNGVILAFLIFTPLLFLIVRLDKSAIPQIMLTTLLLGAGVGTISRILS